MLSLSSGVKRCPMLSPLVGAQVASGTTTTTATAAAATTTSSTTSSTTTPGGPPSLASAPIAHTGLHVPPISAISATRTLTLTLTLNLTLTLALALALALTPDPNQAAEERKEEAERTAQASGDQAAALRGKSHPSHSTALPA